MELEDDPTSFNEHKFEAQYLKYMQVLDTDYDNYLVLYSCQENADFIDKSARELTPQEVWQASLYQVTDKTKPMYAAENFKNLKGIETDFIYKQKIQIFTRPKFIMSSSKYQHLEYPNVKLSELQSAITEKYIPKYFTQHAFDEAYTKMQHDGTCDYNPYDDLAYYNIDAEAPDEAGDKAQEQEKEVPKEDEDPEALYDELWSLIQGNLCRLSDWRFHEISYKN